jgi:hypothetical protein
MRVFRLWANAASSTQPIPEAHISNAATSFSLPSLRCVTVKSKPMRLLLCLLSPLVICHSAFASDPVRIYLANDDHTDYVWSADAETYGRVFVEMLDYHLKLTDETMGNPPPYQNRFNADGSLWLWEYERRTSPPRVRAARGAHQERAPQRPAQRRRLVLRRATDRSGAAWHVLRRPPRTPPRPSISCRPWRWKTSPSRSGWLRSGRAPGPSSVGGVSVVARAK